MELKTVDLVGPSFEELSNDEMEMVQGSGDVKPETTPACLAGFTVGLGIGALASAAGC
ncbi:lichenicidin A2 family type 2 lantibiotic [Priestia megaterium]|uniref:lichenicidin A2 family type 2 lantibiotic n=1 Tax=Priestia megaterium TaxID=1404 RepID=UPI000BF72C51|nr:lichenicidin A2 family type 2 lantibiotic [Priestia megaterium]AUO14642.1 type 2 lantibiotic [Priestia megaterium]PFJ96601.1 type 2 lantibiotic [Priestia megaterium]